MSFDPFSGEALPHVKQEHNNRFPRTEAQMLLAQQSVANLRRILLEARNVHSSQDYLRLAEPILLEVQQREQEIFQYLSAGAEQLRAS